MTSGENAIEITGLSKSFGPYKAVDLLDLTVRKGDIFGFLGPNGAGKTTTLRMLAGLSRPDSGEIRLLGKTVYFGSMSGRESIGYLPDVPECYGYMKPSEFLCFCGALFGLDAKAQKRRADELLELVGLEDAKKRIGGFSRGMKQRIGIAQALVNEPEIVFMDEPASALDPMGRYDVMEILTKLKGNTTVFFSTHIITDIERVCDTVAIIDKGKLLESGSIHDLKMKYDNHTISVDFAVSTTDDEISRFIDSLKQKAWCSGVTCRKGTELQIIVTDRAIAQLELPGIITEHKLLLAAMNSMDISLEDVFFKVVGK
ncbi:MAG: ABC transporter ATP-binding protein [Saccharofermentanales bacterium]